ncbi:MAG: macro domain-containing protein [Clostridiales bacterium]|nr:macro domain-containing protein [Clostridiales bacterium]
MPLQIVRDDITRMSVDAIVNATNPRLIGEGGVDRAIHVAAGEKLLKKCKKIGSCETGQVVLTRGYDLPAKYIIHTVGPVYQDGWHGEEEQLRSCFRNSMKMAARKRCRTLAIPLISTGTYGYPRDQVMQIAIQEISRFLMKMDMMIYLVVFDRASTMISQKLFPDIMEYINERYVEEHSFIRNSQQLPYSQSPLPSPRDSDSIDSKYLKEPMAWETARKQNRNEQFSTNGDIDNRWEPTNEGYGSRQNPRYRYRKGSETVGERHSGPRMGAPVGSSSSRSLDDMIREMDESFSQMLLRKIDEKGMTDAECYIKANIDRKLFSKIRKNPLYKPSKPTAIAFAIALELNLNESREMLMKAGYALSHSNKFDIIIEYFISNGIYNIFEINEALFEFDQSLLGG